VRWVDRPHRAPHRCALVPTRGQMTAGRWCDAGPLGPPGFEQHVYLHESSLREVARDMLGWHPSSELKARDAQISELQEQLAASQRELQAAREQIAAFDVVIGARTSPPPAPVPAAPPPVDPAEQERQQAIRQARLEALARGRAVAAANRAKAREEATT
jgi:hypothetical protein